MGVRSQHFLDPCPGGVYKYAEIKAWHKLIRSEEKQNKDGIHCTKIDTLAMAQSSILPRGVAHTEFPTLGHIHGRKVPHKDRVCINPSKTVVFRTVWCRMIKCCTHE